jgi:diguanylate cyclase (GGDEF)-like protein/PAS domain S-box-containing protein
LFAVSADGHPFNTIDMMLQWAALLAAGLDRAAVIESLRESEQRYALVERSTNDGLWDWNRANDAIYFSPRWKEMLGYADEEIAATPEAWFNLVHPDEREALTAVLDWQISRRLEHIEHEYRILHKDGKYRWMLCRGVVVWYEGATAPRLAGSQTDITAERELEERLARMAHHDALTGLPNRVLLHDRMLQCISVARAEFSTFALVLIDLDKFKVVNDTFGHKAGDRLLQEVATRIYSALRESDTAARLGGDEFAVVLPYAGRWEAEIAAERILGALERPLRLEDTDVDVRASMGIAIFPSNGESYDALLASADAAMYVAKQRRREGSAR